MELFNKNYVLVVVAVLAVSFTGVLVFGSFNYSKVISMFKVSAFESKDQIAQSAVDYINKNLLQGKTATLVSSSEESGVIKVGIKIDDKTFDSYVSKDGKILFPEGYKLESK